MRKNTRNGQHTDEIAQDSDDEDSTVVDYGDENEASAYPRRKFVEYRDERDSVRLSRADKDTIQLYEDARPKTRGDCLEGGVNAERPCPWATCRYHLAHQVIAVKRANATVKLTEDFLDDGAPSCVLDLADSDNVTLADAGRLLGVTRELVRQIEGKAMRRVRLPLYKAWR